MSKVFIAFQLNEDTRQIVEAILIDNSNAEVVEAPAMVKVEAEGRIEIKRATIEEIMGRSFDLQELQVNLITITGHLNEDDDVFELSWKS